MINPCLERRSFLAFAGVLAAAAPGMIGQAFAQGSTASGNRTQVVPDFVPPRIYPALRDPVRLGPAIYDAAPLDYVVEERLMSGIAPIYASVDETDVQIDPPPPGQFANSMGSAGYDNNWTTQQVAIPVFDPNDFSLRPIVATGPYTTRLIIYRPGDMQRFSGNVIVEFMHPNPGATPMWQSVNRFLASEGDVYIGVQHPRNFAWLRYQDPERYGALMCRHFSQVWGTVSDVARVVKQDGEGSPIPTNARRCYLTGYSFTGLMTTTYAKRHHQVNRMADGSALFDGYIAGTGFGPMPDLDVPIMIGANQYMQYNDTDLTLLGNTSPASFSRRERLAFDANEPMKRRRRYEIAGLAHGPLAESEHGSAIGPGGGLTDVRCLVDAPAGAMPSPNALSRPVHEAMFWNMRDWVEKGIVPPSAPLIETIDGRPVLDEFGNVRGGLRLPELTLPMATYGSGTGACSSSGWIIPFQPERLVQLYGNKRSYLQRYNTEVDKLAQQRFIVPYRADQMKLDAARRIPVF